jgi:hypothetical protein
MMALGKKITAPADLPNGRVMRGIAKGIIGAIPVVGSLAAETAELVFPNPEASLRAEWEAEVSRVLNWLGSSVGIFQAPELELTWRIGELFWQIDVDATGRTSIEESCIYEQFSEAADHEVIEAIAELVQLNWCEGWDDPNTKSGYGGFYLKPLLFSYLDPNLRGTSPLDDAVEIVSRLLDVSEDDISSEEIDQMLGWENRRLYPAMWLLSEHVVPPPFNEGQIQAYPIPAFYLYGNNRRSLRKFVNQN